LAQYEIDIPDGLSFAYSFADERGGRYIVNARSGSDIECWMPGNMCFDETMKRVKIKVDYILWHQGESDYNNQNYINDLEYVIKSFRDRLGNIPFIIGELAQWNPELEGINEEIANCDISNTFIVRTDGLTGIDKYHFDTDSTIELGYRYAEVIE